MRLNAGLMVKAAALLWLMIIAVHLAAAEQVPKAALPYERFTLDNGLRVIVHEDHKSPIVSVYVAYEVGSKDEPAGKTGFAHLFEHLMFNGSENFDQDFFLALQDMGATNYNGMTGTDSTDYFQTVPKNALEQILFLESDRMGHLLGAVTPEKLKKQIDVVKNEKRQADAQPLGSRLWYEISKNLYPVGHPYHHSPIGSMADLDNASLEDVHQWFKTYYGAANAILVLVGDIDADEAKPLVEKYFGDIPPGPPLVKRTVDSVPLSANKHSVMYERIAQPSLYRAYVAPPVASTDAPNLSIAAEVLGGGMTSRLHRRLVDDLQIADSVNVTYLGSLLSGRMLITADAKSADVLEQINTTIDEELAALITGGPSSDELDAISRQYTASLALSLETIGGKSMELAVGELFAGDPGYTTDVYAQRIAAATAQQVGRAAGEVFGGGYFELKILPFPDYRAAEPGYARRQGLPPRGVASTDLPFPEWHEQMLANGIRVLVVPWPTASVVQLALQFDAGSEADYVRLPGRRGRTIGLGKRVMALFDRGTRRLSALEIAERQEDLNTMIHGVNLRHATQIHMTAFTDQLRPSLRLLAELVQHAEFPEDELKKRRQEWINDLGDEKANSEALGYRALDAAVYGAGHPYGPPGTIAQEIAATEAVTRADLKAWRNTWLRPERATIFVTGDVTLDTLLLELERAFGKWRGHRGERVAKVPPPRRTNPATPRVIVIDKPDAQQSLILAGCLFDAADGPHDTAIEAMNDSFGGSFMSRINMNLREDKGWSYGVGSYVDQTVSGQNMFALSGSVQRDRTGDAVAELLKEMRAVIGDKPPTEDELRQSVASVVGAQGALFESAEDILQQMLSNNMLARPLDYEAGRASRYRALSVDELRRAARHVIKPQELTWVIVGDWASIQDQVRALDIGTIELRAAGE